MLPEPGPHHHRNREDPEHDTGGLREQSEAEEPEDRQADRNRFTLAQIENDPPLQVRSPPSVTMKEGMFAWATSAP